jgi:hypothetical protein
VAGININPRAVQACGGAKEDNHLHLKSCSPSVARRSTRRSPRINFNSWYTLDSMERACTHCNHHYGDVLRSAVLSLLNEILALDFASFDEDDRGHIFKEQNVQKQQKHTQFVLTILDSARGGRLVLLINNLLRMILLNLQLPFARRAKNLYSCKNITKKCNKWEPHQKSVQSVR